MSSVEGHLVVCVPTDDVAGELAGDAGDMAAILDHVGLIVEDDLSAFARAVADKLTASGWGLLEAMTGAMVAKKVEEGE